MKISQYPIAVALGNVNMIGSDPDDNEATVQIPIQLLIDYIDGQVPYTDELARDAVGGILDTNQFTYDDAAGGGVGSIVIKTGATLTNPVLALAQGAAAAPTAEGRIEWDTDDDALVVGDGAATKIFPSYPASMALGDLILGTANARQVKRLAKGSALQVLRVNAGGTDLEFAAPGGTVNQGTAQVTTSGTAFDYTGIPATAKIIIIQFAGVSLSGTDNLLVQIGPSGGFETTGYDSGSAFLLAAPTITMASSTAGFIVPAGAAVRVVSGTMILTNIDGNQWVASFHGPVTAGTGMGVAGGSKTLAGVLDRVRVTRTGTDTFDLGKVNILYM